jgi:ankyrin repeat protein
LSAVREQNTKIFLKLYFLPIYEKRVHLNYLAGDGLAPLHWAIAPESTASMEKLLKLGAAPDVRSVEGATPIMNAAQSGKNSHLNMLLQAGASVNARDNSGFTALHRAAERGYEEMVDILLKNGADKSVEVKDIQQCHLQRIEGMG